VTDDQVDVAVGSIAFAPSDPNVVYAGLGDPKTGLRYLGDGVLRSSDAGLTWARVSDDSLPSYGTTSKLIIDSRHSDRVYLAQNIALSGAEFVSTGFFVSSNGGISWTKTFTGVTTDVVQHQALPDVLYLGAIKSYEGDSKAGIYRSTDAGLSWRRIYKSPYKGATRDIKLASPAPDLLYVFVGRAGRVRVERSRDGGKTWANLGGSSIDPGQFGYNSCIAADPSEPRRVLLGTRDVYRSNDSGETWVNLTANFSVSGSYNPYGSTAHPDQHALAFVAPGVFLVGNDGGIYKTTNNGDAFEHRNGSLSLSMFTGIAVHPTDPFRTFGGTQDNGTQWRTAAGGAWEEFSPGDGGDTIVDPGDPSTIYSTYIYGNVYKWRDAGFSLLYEGRIGSNAIFGESDSNPRIAFYPPFVTNGMDSTLYFGTWRLFVSRNRGATWEAPAKRLDLTLGNGDVLNAIGAAPSHPDVIYTGSIGGRAMATQDGGLTWRDVTSGLPSRVIRSIAVDPTDPRVVYVTVSGLGTDHVFRSSNGGDTWESRSAGLPDVPVRAMLIDPTDSQRLYAGSDIGVFRSANGGVSWEYLGEGMPPAIVMALAARADGSIVAATYGRGAYELKPPAEAK
jgi:photosystem II stability/assembly factor-like uncharacterized protein